MQKAIFQIQALTILLLTCATSQAAKTHNVNCNKTFQYSSTSIKLTGDYLKKITGSIELTPELLGQVDKWTEISLANQRSICDAYSKSTEEQFSTSDYLEQLERLRSWQLDFVKLVLTQQTVQDKQAAATAGGKGPNDPELGQIKSDFKSQFISFVNNVPTPSVPKSAK